MAEKATSLPRLRVLMLFAGLLLCAWVALALGLWLGYLHLGDPRAASAFLTAGALAGFAILGLIASAWLYLDERMIRPLERLTGAMHARAHAGVVGEIELTGGEHLGEILPAAQALAHRLVETNAALSAAVSRETGRLEGEKARLEAVLSDVGAGVVLCSGDHQMAFYNAQAADYLGTTLAPGLDRSLLGYLRAAPITHAYQRLIEARDPDAVSDLTCATVGEARVLAGRMRLTQGGARLGANPRAKLGYVLTLRDVTADMAQHSAREDLLAEVFARVRQPAANLQMLRGALDRATAEAERKPLTGALLAEVRTLAQAITDLGARYDDSPSAWWPLSLTHADDLADGIRARIGAAGLSSRSDAADLILRCDAFGLVALISSVAVRLSEAGITQSFDLKISEDGAGAMLELGWQGEALALGQFEAWLDAELDVGMADVSGRRVLDSHATLAWPESLGEGRACLRLPLREARHAHARPKPVARSLVYDFDLLTRSRSAALAHTPLSELTYVVFDTETTGLLPDAGDEIVQIAGLRIVNGRRQDREVFDSLVNPGRPIPLASTNVHGISTAMVQDAPSIAEVGRRFHKFAEGAVLVAHNAPFDMAFLRRHEFAIGASFDHPILDTVLLSAVVFGQKETHSLDALTHRLAITIAEEARHTALGDTIATADAFLRLLAMLKARGIITFGEALAEVQKHGRLLQDLNG